jgi:hypothetical protein
MARDGHGSGVTDATSKTGFDGSAATTVRVQRVTRVARAVRVTTTSGADAVGFRARHYIAAAVRPSR